MSLERAITENTAALQELIAILRSNDSTATATVKVTTKEQPATKKDEKVQSSAPTQTASDSSASSSTESPKADAPVGVEYVQIQKLVPQIAKTPEGTEKVVALFGRYGVKRGPELKPEQYDAFYADLVKVDAGELDPRTAEV
ncbi:hypothetical protein ACSBPU_05695 [Parapusillimonas sp. JC17]|uniref:hypothetical protein n=1 Tax=Parapusillimonas sp. JC17 TaxID=3445768 RepID=UPI003FA06D04